METRKAESYRETAKALDGPLIRKLPAGPDGGEITASAGSCVYAVSREREGRSLEGLLVLVASGMPFGLFMEMDAASARMLGKTLLAMADKLPGPQPEPEIREKNGAPA